MKRKIKNIIKKYLWRMQNLRNCKGLFRMVENGGGELACRD